MTKDVIRRLYLSSKSRASQDLAPLHPHFTSDWFLRAWAVFSAVTVHRHRLLLPFQRGIVLVQMEMKELRSETRSRAFGGGGGETLDFNASVSHSLILLWRRNRWRKLIYIDFNWILCFVILKGHNYFHCEVFMIQWNCFLAKHNCFEACLIVVSGFHFCSFSA